MRKIALTLIVAGAALATEASAQVMVRASSVPGGAVGRFRDGDCDFERRGTNLGDIFFGLRTSRRDSDRDCRVSSSRTRDLGVWYPVGRDRSGNVIYERRVRDRSGRTIVERARSRDGRTLTRIASNGRVNGDRDRDDDDFDRRISRAEHDRRKAIEKARRDREKAVRKVQKDRAKAIERARRDAERNRRGKGRVG
ncbi:MAG: hypothetical protein WDZ58_07425 [Gemmatimonadaceae bacterium]